MKTFLKESLVVMIGGGLGTLSRFFVGEGLDHFSFEIVILIINLTGCFVCGLLLGLLENKASDVSKAFIFIGFLGSFTTLSDLSYIVNNLILKRAFLQALFNISASVLGGLFLFSLGYFFSRKQLSQK